MEIERFFESSLLPQRRCQEIFAAVAASARAKGVHDVEAAMGTSADALTRFANNSIHQNVAERRHYLSVRVIIGHRTARATTNRLDPDSIRRVVDEAVTLARLEHPNPGLPPLAVPGDIRPAFRYIPSTAEATPEDRSRAVAEAISIAAGEGLTAAGIFSTNQSVYAILNSNGMFAYHPETMAQFSITVMGGDSSGWAKASSCDYRTLEVLHLARVAADKARHSSAPREVPAGRYTVILEPAAVLDLVGQMFPDFSATAVPEGRSFLKGRIGEKLFGANINIRDDAFHPLQAGAPFDGEGVPRQPLNLVTNGVVERVPYCRQAALQAQAEPTGHGFQVPNELGEAPSNLVMLGGNSSVDRMIAATERGILVTRLWYIREVDPYAKIMTGMTRDGTFLVEGGNVVSGLRNFRFNQSLIELLSQVTEMSPEERVSGEETFDMVVPGLRAENFHFTEVTKF